MTDYYDQALEVAKESIWRAPIFRVLRVIEGAIERGMRINECMVSAKSA